MSFFKAVETRFGIVLVRKDQNDDGFPMLRWAAELDRNFVDVTFTVRDASDAGWEQLQKMFDECDTEKVEEGMGGLADNILSVFEDGSEEALG